MYVINHGHEEAGVNASTFIQSKAVKIDPFQAASQSLLSCCKVAI